jgi:hypothetical protein
VTVGVAPMIHSQGRESACCLRQSRGVTIDHMFTGWQSVATRSIRETCLMQRYGPWTNLLHNFLFEELIVPSGLPTLLSVAAEVVARALLTCLGRPNATHLEMTVLETVFGAIDVQRE